MSEQNITARRRTTRRSAEARFVNATVLVGIGVLLFMVLVWLVDLEQRLPDVRAPSEFSNSTVLTGHAIMPPGFHEIETVDAELDGDWITQEIGDSTWLATNTPGSRLQAAFYGTNVNLIARIGPDAGQAYVRVDGRPVEGLIEDEDGKFIDLWAGEAANQPILLVSGLAHGEHVVEITSGGEDEIAISGFEIAAETPFQWAFLLAYAGVGGGLFVVIRQLLAAISRKEPPDAPSLDRANEDASA